MDTDEYLESWNLLGEVDTGSFAQGVREMRAQATATLGTPREQRGKPPFER